MKPTKPRLFRPTLVLAAASSLLIGLGPAPASAVVHDTQSVSDPARDEGAPASQDLRRAVVKHVYDSKGEALIFSEVMRGATRKNTSSYVQYKDAAGDSYHLEGSHKFGIRIWWFKKDYSASKIVRCGACRWTTKVGSRTMTMRVPWAMTNLGKPGGAAHLSRLMASTGYQYRMADGGVGSAGVGDNSRFFGRLY